MKEDELREMAAQALRFAGEVTDPEVAARFKLMAADLMTLADKALQQRTHPERKDDSE